jgi:hypothetical protein
MLSSNVLCTFLTNTHLILTLWTWRQLLWIRNINFTYPPFSYQKITGIETAANFSKIPSDCYHLIISFSKAAFDNTDSYFAVYLHYTGYTYFYNYFFHFDGFRVPWLRCKKIRCPSTSHITRTNLGNFTRINHKRDPRFSRKIFESRKLTKRGTFNTNQTHSARIAHGVISSSKGLIIEFPGNYFACDYQSSLTRAGNKHSNTVFQCFGTHTTLSGILIKSSKHSSITTPALIISGSTLYHSHVDTRYLQEPSRHTYLISFLYIYRTLESTSLLALDDGRPERSEPAEEEYGLTVTEAQDDGTAIWPGAHSLTRTVYGDGYVEDAQYLEVFTDHELTTGSHWTTRIRFHVDSADTSRWQKHPGHIHQLPGHDNCIGMHGMRTEAEQDEAWQVLHQGLHDYSTLAILLHSTPWGILDEVLSSLIDTSHSMTGVPIETSLGASVNTLSTMTRTADKRGWLDNSGPNQLHIQAWTEREAGEDSIPFIYDE